MTEGLGCPSSLELSSQHCGPWMVGTNLIFALLAFGFVLGSIPFVYTSPIPFYVGYIIWH